MVGHPVLCVSCMTKCPPLACQRRWKKRLWRQWMLCHSIAPAIGSCKPNHRACLHCLLISLKETGSKWSKCTSWTVWGSSVKGSGSWECFQWRRTQSGLVWPHCYMWLLLCTSLQCLHHMRSMTWQKTWHRCSAALSHARQTSMVWRFIRSRLPSCHPTSWKQPMVRKSLQWWIFPWLHTIPKSLWEAHPVSWPQTVAHRKRLDLAKLKSLSWMLSWMPFWTSGVKGRVLAKSILLALVMHLWALHPTALPGLFWEPPPGHFPLKMRPQLRRAWLSSQEMAKSKRTWKTSKKRHFKHCRTGGQKPKQRAKQGQKANAWIKHLLPPRGKSWRDLLPVPVLPMGPRVNLAQEPYLDACDAGAMWKVVKHVGMTPSKGRDLLRDLSGVPMHKSMGINRFHVEDRGCKGQAPRLLL